MSNKDKPTNLLRAARVELSLTQEEVAEKIGTTSLTVGRWERSEALPSPQFRRALSDFYKKSPEELGLIPREDSSNDEETALSRPLEDLPRDQDVGTLLSTPAHTGLPSPVKLQPKPKARISRRKLLQIGVGASVAVAAASVSVSFWFRSTTKGTTTVNFACSTDKVAWITAAVNAFNMQSRSTADGKGIHVEILDTGSLDAVARIVDGTFKPSVWSPASSLELALLGRRWQQYHRSEDIIFDTGDLAPKSLVFTPLVFAIWKERAEVLLRHYSSINWANIHNALTLKNGWAEIGGSPEWGLVKFGHTRPDLSSDGLLTIALIAYAYFTTQRTLTVEQVSDPQFLTYLSDFENAVNAFGRSSGTFFETVVLPEGPAQYDVITTYENLVLASQQEATRIQGQPLQMFYPNLTIVSDHPFAILQGGWATPEEQEAARIFRDFLLAKEQQQLALTFGFRPANPAVQITSKIPGNPFLNPPSGSAIQSPVQPLAQLPTGEVIDELITQWRTRYDGTVTANG